MLATNHALTGALVSTVLPLPLAIPVAFVSHFAMDAIPHYGVHDHKRDSSTLFRTIVFSDTVIALVLVVPAIIYHRWAMIICGAAAYSPDITLIYSYFINGRSLSVSHQKGLLTNFHIKIQYERAWGIIVELLILAVLLPLFVHVLHS